MTMVGSTLPEPCAAFAFAVRWSRYFPNHGPGTYRVRFRLPGAPSFSPPLSFRRS
jgi:hypothetical protein